MIDGGRGENTSLAMRVRENPQRKKHLRTDLNEEKKSASKALKRTALQVGQE